MMPGNVNQEYKYLGIIAKTWNEVYEAENAQTGQKCCIKQVMIEPLMREKFQQEIQILQQIKDKPHDNIIGYIESFYYEKMTVQEKPILFGCIVMEQGITNLSKYIKSKKKLEHDFKFSDYEVADFFNTMISAHAHLQQMKLAHRDIKPENILLTNEDRLLFKVCDVGFGTYTTDEATAIRTIGGTVSYQSPEVFLAYKQKQHRANYNPFKSDVFSLGLVLMYFATTQNIEKQNHDELLSDQKKFEDYVTEIRHKIKQQYPRLKGVTKILKMMLEYSPEQRYDFIQVQQVISLNEYLEVKSPAKITHSNFQSITQLQDVQIDNKEEVQLDLSGLNKPPDEQLKILQSIAKQIKNYNMSSFVLKLELCNLNVRTIAPVVKILNHQRNLIELQLKLWNNKLGNLGLLFLVKAIMKMEDLKKFTFEISNNSLSEEGINNALPLLNNLIQMEEITLDFGLNHLPMECSESFFILLNCMPRLIKLELNLESNYMNQVLTKYLTQTLKKLPLLNTLIINFSNNPMHNEGLFDLGDCINDLEHLELILWGCQIKDLGLEEFAKGLTRCNKLKILHLILWNNQITKKSCEALGQAFLKLTNLNNLQIDLTKNKIEDEGVRFLAKAIYEMPIQLSELKFWIENVSCTSYGLRYVCNFLKSQKSIRKLNLNLRSNQITLEGIELLFVGFQGAFQIQELNLSLCHNPLEDQGVQTLLKGLTKIKELQKLILNLENVKGTGASTTHMLNSIKSWGSLKELHVNFFKNDADEADERQLRLRLQELQHSAKIIIEIKTINK